MNQQEEYDKRFPRAKSQKGVSGAFMTTLVDQLAPKTVPRLQALLENSTLV